MISGSVEEFELETRIRLGILYTKHHSWLMACAYNQSNDKQVSEDLVQELYLYLAQKNNYKLYYSDSFNLLYCHNFIKSRYINWIKRENKLCYLEDTTDMEDEPYNIDYDVSLEQSYDLIKKELKDLSTTKMWPAAKLYEMYAFCDITMDELSKNVGISKSTTFLSISKIKKHLKSKIDNPFKNNKDE